MRNKTDLFLIALLMPVDFSMIILGGLLSFYLRFSSFVLEIRPALFSISVRTYFYALLGVATLAIFVFTLNDLYLFRRKPFYKKLAKIFFATSTTLMLVILYLFFIKESFSSRFIVLFTWISATFFVILGRVWVLSLRRFLYKKDFALKSIILVGSDKSTEDMYKYLQIKQRLLGYKVVAIARNKERLFADLNLYMKDYPMVQELWQCDANISRIDSVKLIDFTIKYHIAFKYITGNFESRTTNIDVDIINGVPVVELKKTPLEAWGRIVKRIIDIIGALFALIIFSPILLITAIAIKIESKGPLIPDIPERAGQYASSFRFFKFRSMYVGAHKDQSKVKSDREGLFKAKEDPRITKVGAFIRKWSIDELPQLFNVLIGNMSLVGPRPHYTYEYQEHHKRSLTVKPGITGMAQISGRSDLSFDDEVQLDLHYIEHWSLWLDFWILLRTPLAVFKNRKAS